MNVDLHFEIIPSCFVRIKMYKGKENGNGETKRK